MNSVKFQGYIFLSQSERTTHAHYKQNKSNGSLKNPAKPKDPKVSKHFKQQSNET